MPFTTDTSFEHKANLNWQGIVSEEHHEDVNQLVNNPAARALYDELPDHIDISDYEFKLRASEEARRRGINYKFIGTLDLAFHYFLKQDQENA